MVLFKKIDPSEEALSFKFVLTVTLIYFFGMFPAIQFFLRGHSWIPQYGTIIYFAVIFAYVLGIKKISLKQLGFSSQHLGNHLLIGGVLGSLIVSALPLLDTLISFTGLGQNELFSEAANQRNQDDWNDYHPLGFAARVLIVPFFTQFFFTGLLFPGLSRKYNPLLALYGAGLLFTLGHFQLNLGLIILGIVSAFLFRLTGTLFASILFHMGCALSGILLVYIYPRLITIFIFLY